MFLHARDAARIEWCDTINSPRLVEGDHLMRFDVVVANPPFSLEKWGADHAAADQYRRFWRGIPPKSKGDYAFITHMVEIAKRQSGRVAVLVFDRSREQGGANANRRDVLFIDASKDFTPGKNRNTMGETHINKVLDTYRARAAVEQYAHLASPEEIMENGYNLNIPRYVDTFEPEEDIDLAAVQQHIEHVESELAEVQAKMAGYLKELGIHG